VRQLLHRTFDNWHGLGMMTVGVERLGYRLSLSQSRPGSGALTSPATTRSSPRLGMGWRRRRGRGADGGAGGGEVELVAGQRYADFFIDVCWRIFRSQHPAW